jgi:hypothetical protein
MQVERYRIILTGWLVSGQQKRDVVAELSRLFKIPEDQVGPLLDGEPSIIRRDLSLEKAGRLRNKIEQRGAVCNLKLIMREEHEDRGYSIDKTGILEPDLNMDSTQFVQLTVDSSPPVKRRTATTASACNSGGGSGKRKGRRVVSRVLFAGSIVAVLAWGYLYLYPDRYSSSLDPKILTLSPAKEVGSVESEGGL